MKKKEEKSESLQKKGQMLMLYQTIKDIRSGSMKEESLFKYIKLRVQLSNIASEFDKLREEASNQTKPENWKDGDSTAEWDKKFQEIIDSWAAEEIELNTHILTEDEGIDLVFSNPDLKGSMQDLIMFNLIIK